MRDSRAAIRRPANRRSERHKETIMTKLFMDNLALFLPMTLAGLLLVSEVHCVTRLVRTSVRTCGAVMGLLAALVVVEVLPLLI